MSVKKGPWSDLDISSPIMQRLASAGSHALANGLVDPDEAQTIAETMGISPKKGQGGQKEAPLPGQPSPDAIGASSPEDAQMLARRAEKLSPGPLKPGPMVASRAYNPLAIGVDPAAQDQGPLAMTAGDLYANQGVGDIGDKKGAKAEATRQQTSTFKRSNNRYLTKPMEQTRAEQMMAQGVYPKVSSYEPATDENGNPQFDHAGNPVLDKDRPIYDFNTTETDESNPVRQQQKGLGRMEDLLKMQQQYEGARSHADLSPLAALADAVSQGNGRPSNLAAHIKAPTDNTAKFMEYADEIQKRRADIQKAISEGVKAQKGGTTMDMLTQALLAKDIAGQSNPTLDRQGMQNERLDFQAHQQTVRAIRNDKNLRDKLVQYQNLGNALSNLVNADHMTPQQFDEAQQAIRANLGIKGSSGVGERERTQLNSLGISADRIAQILSSKPSDITAPEFVDHIKDLAGLETSNIRQQFGSRLEAVSGGNASMYARRPDLKSDLLSMVGSNQAQLAPLKTSAKAAKKPVTQAQKAAASSEKPMSIDQFFGGGH